MCHVNRNLHSLWRWGAGRAGFHILFYQGPNLLSGALNWGETFYFFQGLPRLSARPTETYTSSALTVIHVHSLSKPSARSELCAGRQWRTRCGTACDELPWGMAAGQWAGSAGLIGHGCGNELPRVWWLLEAAIS